MIGGGGQHSESKNAGGEKEGEDNLAQRWGEGSGPPATACRWSGKWKVGLGAKSRAAGGGGGRQSRAVFFAPRSWVPCLVQRKTSVTA